MYNCVCPVHCVATDFVLRRTNFYFSRKDLDVAIERLSPGTGFDNVHTPYIEKSRLCYGNFFMYIF